MGEWLTNKSLGQKLFCAKITYFIVPVLTNNHSWPTTSPCIEQFKFLRDTLPEIRIIPPHTACMNEHRGKYFT